MKFKIATKDGEHEVEGDDFAIVEGGTLLITRGQFDTPLGDTRNYAAFAAGSWVGVIEATEAH